MDNTVASSSITLVLPILCSCAAWTVLRRFLKCTVSLEIDKADDYCAPREICANINRAFMNTNKALSPLAQNSERARHGLKHITHANPVKYR